MQRVTYTAVLTVVLIFSAGTNGVAAADIANSTTVDTSALTAVDPDDGSVDDRRVTTAQDRNQPVTTVRQSNESQRPDPESDRIGWEDGYWYDDPVAVNQSDGLNESELSAVVSRAMARIERVRQLEFKKRPPVEVVSREAYANATAGSYQNVSTNERLFHETLAEARFFASEDESWIDSLDKVNTVSVGGFYSPSADRIVVISDSPNTPKLNEITLAQELMHALQDQRFNLTNRYLGSFRNGTMTTERHNSYDAIIEGDGNYVDFLYQQRCEANWSCLEDTGSTGGTTFYTPGEFGAIVTQLAPYSDGVSFVRSIYKSGGWEAVNNLYRNGIDSTEQIIHPNRYPDDTPTTVTITDETTGEWERLTPPSDGKIGGLPGSNASYAEFGEAGMVGMFIAPSRAETSPVVIGYDAFFRGNSYDAYTYDFRPTDGWDGDRLVVYVTNDSGKTNETAFVWQSEWDSPEDANQFASAYTELLNYHDAEQVGPNTYRMPNDEQFSDAFHITTDGTTVTIVSAPTTDQLSDVRTSIKVRELTPTPTATPTPTESMTSTVSATPITATTTPASVEETTADGPGFTVTVLVFAVLVTTLMLRRRQ